MWHVFGKFGNFKDGVIIVKLNRVKYLSHYQCFNPILGDI